jgi:hypothetical protein
VKEKFDVEVGRYYFGKLGKGQQRFKSIPLRVLPLEKEDNINNFLF